MNKKDMSLSLLRRLLAVLAIAFLMAGCSSYRLGSMLPEKYDTVAVPTFRNLTSEPLLQDKTTSATISEFQMDGSLQIADSSKADAILKVTLRDLSMRPISFSDDRARQANEYRLYITASFVLVDRVTDEVVAQNPAVQGAADFIVSGDLTTSKNTAIPEASEDLAHAIVEKVVEDW